MKIPPASSIDTSGARPTRTPPQLPLQVQLARARPNGVLDDTVLGSVGVDAVTSLACQFFYMDWAQKTAEATP